MFNAEAQGAIGSSDMATQGKQERKRTFYEKLQNVRKKLLERQGVAGPEKGATDTGAAQGEAGPTY